MAMTKATFENTYPRYPFAPLVELALMIANRIKPTDEPVGLRDTTPVNRLHRQTDRPEVSPATAADNA
jgi:hypothetical protein